MPIEKEFGVRKPVARDSVASNSMGTAPAPRSKEATANSGSKPPSKPIAPILTKPASKS